MPEVLEIDGREVTVSNPDKVFFPAIGVTKMDLVRYYLAVAEGALRGARDRPAILNRFPNGVEGDSFFQKRVPAKRSDWLRTALVRFPSGRTADLLTVHDTAHLIWMVNLGCIEINPWPVRHGVFVDFNMNARDRTLASAYSVRPTPDARVSCPLEWEEVPDAEPGDFTIANVPARFAERGDPSAEIDDHVGSLDPLLELAARDEAGGLGDAPWPPHFPKAKGEPPRVAPSRARKRSRKR